MAKQVVCPNCGKVEGPNHSRYCGGPGVAYDEVLPQVEAKCGCNCVCTGCREGSHHCGNTRKKCFYYADIAVVMR